MSSLGGSEVIPPPILSLGVSPRVTSKVYDISLSVGYEVDLGSTTTCVRHGANNDPLSGGTPTAANDDSADGTLNHVGTAGGPRGTTGSSGLFKRRSIPGADAILIGASFHHPRRVRFR